MAKQVRSDRDPGRRYADRRRAALRALKQQTKAEAMLVTDGCDIRYLTGLTEGSRTVLIARGLSVVLTNRMFAGCAPVEAVGSEVIITSKADDQHLAELIRKHKIRKLAFQEDLVTLARYRSVAEAVGERKLVPTRGLIVGVRSVKDEEEIATTRKAIRIAEKGLKQMMEQGAKHFVGRAEKSIATELEHRMRELGADRQGFPFNGIIVASGPNSASCHHFPTNRKIRKNESLLIDWGAELDGYRSDMTRVLFMHKPPEIYHEIYPLVERAYKAGIAALKPGVTNHRIDRASRSVIEAGGHGELFRHGLGHGIGLQIHEDPRLSGAGEPVRLKKNQIVTIEPGVYFDGHAGCRLEDDILIVPGGHKNLCAMTTRMERMILR